MNPNWHPRTPRGGCGDGVSEEGVGMGFQVGSEEGSDVWRVSDVPPSSDEEGSKSELDVWSLFDCCILLGGGVEGDTVVWSDWFVLLSSETMEKDRRNGKW